MLRMVIVIALRLWDGQPLLYAHTFDGHQRPWFRTRVRPQFECVCEDSPAIHRWVYLCEAGCIPHRRACSPADICRGAVIGTIGMGRDIHNHLARYSQRMLALLVTRPCGCGQVGDSASGRRNDAVQRAGLTTGTVNVDQ